MRFSFCAVAELPVASTQASGGCSAVRFCRRLGARPSPVTAPWTRYSGYLAGGQRCPGLHQKNRAAGCASRCMIALSGPLGLKRSPAGAYACRVSGCTHGSFPLHLLEQCSGLAFQLVCTLLRLKSVATLSARDRELSGMQR
jgi:hypothetical protein